MWQRALALVERAVSGMLTFLLARFAQIGRLTDVHLRVALLGETAAFLRGFRLLGVASEPHNREG